MPSLLLITIFLPLAGAALIWVLAEAGQVLARRIALAVSLVTLALAAAVVLRFDPAAKDAIDWPWFTSAPVDIHFSLALDGLSLWFFGLSALLTLTCVLVSWEAIDDRAPAFYSLLLLLETGMLGVFAARDIILFYVFFEFTLIPLFFLIGIWGSEDRRYAALKFFLFTLGGSLLTFLGLVAIVLWNYYYVEPHVMTFSIAALQSNLSAQPITFHVQLLLFLALFAGFAIKVPLFPLHTWLPLAHTQAPTAGSVILAGILLKIGGYGFLRFSLPMLPDATAACIPWLLWLSVAGIIYGALVALAQTNIKKLIAYSSVSHLGFCMLGTFALNKPGLYGGVLQMVNHGLSTGGLFALVGMIYERYHTREIADLGGLARRLPLLATFMGLFMMSSIGLPGMNGFAGEFLILVGMFQRGYAEAPLVYAAQWLAIAVLAVSGVVLGAWYMLWLFERVFFNRLREPAHHEGPPIRDMSLREVLALAPLLVFVFWIGLFPQHFIKPMEPDLDHVLAVTTPSFNQRYQEIKDRPVVARHPSDSYGRWLGQSLSDAPVEARRLPTAPGSGSEEVRARGEVARVE
jgi:NADH-quinone oxidoreductase subunit M